MGLLKELKTAGIAGPDALRGIVRGLRPLHSYGDIGIVDDEQGVSVGRIAGPTIYVNKGMARVVSAGPNGEADFTNHRYWMELLMPKSGTGKIDAAINLVIDRTNDYTIIPATNVCESAANPTDPKTEVKGCHLLSPGDKAWIFATEDDDGLDRYIFFLSPSPVSVHITDAVGCGKGFYNATAIKRPTSDIDKSTNLASADVGGVGPVVIVRNLQEINRASANPWLTAAGNTDQLDFAGGKLAYVNSDGTPVIDFNALWVKPCGS